MTPVICIFLSRFSSCVVSPAQSKNTFVFFYGYNLILQLSSHSKGKNRHTENSLLFCGNQNMRHPGSVLGLRCSFKFSAMKAGQTVLGNGTVPVPGEARGSVCPQRCSQPVIPAGQRQSAAGTSWDGHCLSHHNCRRTKVLERPWYSGLLHSE